MKKQKNFVWTVFAVSVFIISFTLFISSIVIHFFSWKGVLISAVCGLVIWLVYFILVIVLHSKQEKKELQSADTPDVAMAQQQIIHEIESMNEPATTSDEPVAASDEPNVIQEETPL